MEHSARGLNIKATESIVADSEPENEHDMGLSVYQQRN